MTDAGSAYLNMLNTAARWVEVHARQKEQRPPLCTLAQIIYTLLDVATPTARREVKRAMLSLTSTQMINGLEALTERYGGDTALAARDLTKTLVSTPRHSDVLIALNLLLTQFGYPPLAEPTLSPAQRTLGSLFMDLISYQREMDGLDQVAWISIQGHQGAAALSLLVLDLKKSERVALSFLMLQGLAEMHQARLEPEEGLAPERMLINERFEVMSFPTERTRIPGLKSPEQRAKLALDKHSDVWTLAQLFDQLYQGRDLGRRLSGRLTVPDEVDAVLVRSLSRRPKDRFHSGRELRVVLEKPLLTWRDRLLHEEQQSTGLIEASLTFDELTERQDQEMEERVQERRKNELKTRKRLQWRAARRQLLWILVISIIGLAGLWSWLNSRRAHLNTAVERRAEFNLRDQEHNPRGEDEYAHRQVHWRYVEVFGARPALVSVSQVTAAQYLHCVNEGACPELAPSRPFGCVQRPTQQPINCVAPTQALAFARSVDAELLEPEVWRWLTLGQSDQRAFPWGDRKVTSKHAVLRWNNLPQFNTDEPREVCTLPLGDSIDGLCDLVGNIREWVLLPEVAKRLRDAKTKGKPEPIILAHDTFGVVGADWKTRANALNLKYVESAKAMVFSEAVGFRVIKWLDQPQPAAEPPTPTTTQDSPVPTPPLDTSPSATPAPVVDSPPSPKERGDD